MFEAARFRLDLAARIVGLLGTVSLATAPWGCTSTEGPSATGAGGAMSTVSTTGAGAGADSLPLTQQCFVWSADMGGCPTSEAAVLAQLKCCGCPTGWEPATVVSPPSAMQDDQCCYMVTLELCAGAGRPYMVGDQARVAAVERVGGARGWSLGARPVVDDLDVEQRALLAEAWMADASLEHASVASFSRFALALLAAGAPADLVELAHRAALDEVRHAQLCFGLASAYAGEDIAPGPFPLGRDVRVEASLLAIAVSTVREGCIGETLSAVVAAEQLASATDPAVRAVLAQIADDEARHAELAWRTVAWAVQAGGPEVRAAVARAFFQALAASRRTGLRAPGALEDPLRDGSSTPELPSSGALAAHGRLDHAALARASASAMVDIVAPAARKLFQLETGP